MKCAGKGNEREGKGWVGSIFYSGTRCQYAQFNSYFFKDRQTFQGNEKPDNTWKQNSATERPILLTVLKFWLVQNWWLPILELICFPPQRWDIINRFGKQCIILTLISHREYYYNVTSLRYVPSGIKLNCLRGLSGMYGRVVHKEQD